MLAWPSCALLYSVPIVTSGAVAFDSGNHLFISLAPSILEYDQNGQFLRTHVTSRGSIANNIVVLNNNNTSGNVTIVFSTRQTNLCWAPPSYSDVDNSTNACTTVDYIASSPSALTQGPDSTIVGIGLRSFIVFGSPVITHSSGGMNVGNIVGAVVGSVVFVLLNIACFWMLCKGKLRRRSGSDNVDMEPQDERGISQARRALL